MFDLLIKGGRVLDPASGRDGLADVAIEGTGTKLMIHIGDKEASPGDPTLTAAVLERLDPGDILTHLFTFRSGSIPNSNGRILPQVKEAHDRGVILDPALGCNNFSFNLARRVLDQGIVPDTISTDITVRGRSQLLYSLTESMSKFMVLGFTLMDVVRMTTVNPARALGLENHIGTLQPGYEADVTVLDLVDGRWTYHDLDGGTAYGDRALAPVVTVKGGDVIPVGWGPHPWEWLPEPGPGA